MTASADISVAKTLLSGNPVAGGSATWQIVVRDSGPSDAADVVIDDTAPTGVSFTGSVDNPGVRDHRREPALCRRCGGQQRPGA